MVKIQDQFEVLRKINKSEKSTQRTLSYQLGFSLGKLNYCLKRLKKHGLIRIKRFKRRRISLIICMCLHPEE
jgi:predicted transcriptional regulator